MTLYTCIDPANNCDSDIANAYIATYSFSTLFMVHDIVIGKRLTCMHTCFCKHAYHDISLVKYRDA